MESQPQNPEFRINPKNFHLLKCTAAVVCDNPVRNIVVAAAGCIQELTNQGTSLTI